MSQLSTRHLLGIKDLTSQDIQLILDTAEQFKAVINRPIKKVPSCGILPLPTFLRIQPRTRVSFELAQKKAFCRYH